MSTSKKKPVTLIVADSGPLISLACADELRLLQSFGRPVVIPDVVRLECTVRLGAPGEDRLANWFESTGGNQYREIRTPFMQVYLDALARVRSGEDPRAATGLGDASISWLLKNLDRLKTVHGQSVALAGNEVALLMTEDGPFGDGPVLEAVIDGRQDERRFGA